VALCFARKLTDFRLHSVPLTAHAGAETLRGGNYVVCANVSGGNGRCRKSGPSVNMIHVGGIWYWKAVGWFCCSFGSVPRFVLVVARENTTMDIKEIRWVGGGDSDGCCDTALNLGVQ